MPVGTLTVSRNRVRKHIEIGRVFKQFERGFRILGGSGGMGRTYHHLQNSSGTRYSK
jgi:hypothetical protein